MRRLLCVPALLTLLLASPASALEVEIANRSGHSPDQVYVTVAGQPGSFDVSGVSNDVPVKLSEIPDQTLTVNQLVSGRLYVAYGQGVDQSVSWDSPTRFHWVEFTVTPSSTDVANLTAVDQFGIAMRLDTLNRSGQLLETLSTANANRVFRALRSIPGGKGATVKGSDGRILRVLSPIHADTYPLLGRYVRGMAGQTVALRTAFFGTPFTTSSYSGTFRADGSITLRGSTDPDSQAPSEIAIDGAQLINDIYTGGNTPNNMQGALYRDLLAGFSAGLWGGRYGNDALGFCSDPVTTAQGSWCPHGFNKPVFGDARRGLEPYATCEQYAAEINRLTDAYGNPYSDASKKVQIGISQPQTGGEVEALRVTALPDAGKAKPQQRGDSICGAASLKGSSIKAFSTTKARRNVVRVARVACPAACGKLKLSAVPRRRAAGARHRVLGRGKVTISNRGSRSLKLKLNRRGKKLVGNQDQARVQYKVKLKRGGTTIAARSWNAVLFGRG
jgi:hypothetical protein